MVPACGLRFVLALSAIGILAGPATAADLREHIHEVRKFTFEESDDRNFDQDPDDWSRRRGPQFPDFVLARIDRNLAHEGEQSLRFELNGALAAYYSPLIRIEQAQSFLMQGFVRTKGLERDSAVITFSVLDAQRRRLQRHTSKAVSGTSDGWVQLDVGPVTVPDNARFLVLGCHVVGGSRHDVKGEVWFDDLWLGGLPLVVLKTADGRHYYRPGEPVEFLAEVRGELQSLAYDLLLQLEDETGKILDSKSQTLFADRAETRPAGPEARTANPIAIRWSVAVPQNGYYRMAARFSHKQTIVSETATTLAVLDAPCNTPEGGEFGWSLTEGSKQLPLPALAAVAPEAGLSWVKFPLWSAASGKSRPDVELLLDELDRQQISLVGLLSDPPDQLSEKFAQRHVSVSKIFSHSRDLWASSLEPLIARYAFRVRHWQLGHESDGGFVGMDALVPTLNHVKRDFDRVGSDSRIGVPWNWEPPKGEPPPLGFLSLAHPAGSSADDLVGRLKQVQSHPMPRWVFLEPLARRDEHPLSERVIDLCRRMVAAKVAGAEGVFVEPLSDATGVIHEDGSPRELFLPWRTFAIALRGAEYLGSLELPERSPNAFFRRGSDVALVVWNDSPARESLYLGEDVRVMDVWGRTSPLAADKSTGQHTLSVGRLPQIVLGASDAVARWRLALKFEKGRIPSEYGEHEEALLVTNTFPQGITGNATLRMPPGWEVEPSRWPFQAAAGETVKLPVQLKFPIDASLGPFRPQVEFEIAAERTYRFSQEVPFQLGTGDVLLDVAIRRTPEGRLEIEQKITNATEPLEDLSFSCQLFVPGQIRQKQTATKVGRTPDLRLYHVANPKSLKGRDLWLQVEEIDGRRVLNKHIRVE